MRSYLLFSPDYLEFSRVRFSLRGNVLSLQPDCNLATAVLMERVDRYWRNDLVDLGYSDCVSWLTAKLGGNRRQSFRMEEGQPDWCNVFYYTRLQPLEMQVILYLLRNYRQKLSLPLSSESLAALECSDSDLKLLTTLFA